jgi:hypothetical protein
MSRTPATGVMPITFIDRCRPARPTMSVRPAPGLRAVRCGPDQRACIRRARYRLAGSLPNHRRSDLPSYNQPTLTNCSEFFRSGRESS